jgi:hypothetical protein
MLQSVIVSVLKLLSLDGLWSVLHIPRCRTCRVPLQPAGETLRPLSWYGVEAVYHYECPECFWTTQRRHILIHFH